MVSKTDRKRKCKLGENLNFLLKLHNIDIKNLALSVGMPASTIARMRRKGNPTIASLEPLLDFFRVDMDTLLYTDMSHPDYQTKCRSGKLLHVPVFNLETITSSFRITNQSSKITKFVGAAGISGKRIFGVSIDTLSLAPIFRSNSIVIIDPDLTPKESDYVLCCLDNETVPVFRQIFMDGNQWFFKPVNPGFGEMQFYKKFKIMGVVVKSVELYR